MVNSYLLAKIVKYNKYSLEELARILQLDKKELIKKFKHGVWDSNELEIMLHIMDWPVDPMECFFSTYIQNEEERF